MKRQAFILQISLFILVVQISVASATFNNPRIGLVVSRASFEHNWKVTQMAAHGWVAVAHLAGIPYDCLLISEIVETGDLSKYSVLVFGQCTYVEERVYSGLIKALKNYLNHGGNLIIDGPLCFYDKNAQQRNHGELDKLLGIEYLGFHGNSDYRIRVATNLHYITRPFECSQFITQHLAGGLNILKFKDRGQDLLVASDENTSYPFLSATESNRSRLILISDLSTWAGVASFFRNNHPQGFYPNRIFEVLIKAVHWSIYGDIERPFPVPQVSNGNLTAIVRVDADEGYELDVQTNTINYLINLAKETGVVPVYGLISNEATKAGWENLAYLGKKLEEVGGQIGTHSKSHFFSHDLNEQLAKEELDDSIQEIEFNMNKYDFPIGKIEFFINPNITIHMDDYEHIAKRFSFYMTHGFERAMPLGYGNMTWFTGSYKNLVVLENSPCSDWNWFYYPEWSYSTAQITTYQEAIFDHMYQNIGRGIVFNQMWHDYSITSLQLHKTKRLNFMDNFLKFFTKKRRILNDSNLALYEAMKTKFATHDIYCPDPVDLANKLLTMAQWNYSWNSNENQVEINLDLSEVILNTVVHYTGGMGIKIENTRDRIQKVLINGKPHYAFSDQVIILPNLMKNENKIVVTLGPYSSRAPHLTFISKRMPYIRKIKDRLEMTVLTKSKAKFSFYTEAPFILLNADWQEWDRNGNEILKGYVTSNRQLLLKKISKFDFVVSRSTVPIVDFNESESSMILTLGNNNLMERTIWFRSGKKPRKMLLNEQLLEVTKHGKNFHVALPEYGHRAKLNIMMF